MWHVFILITFFLLLKKTEKLLQPRQVQTNGVQKKKFKKK